MVGIISQVIPASDHHVVPLKLTQYNKEILSVKKGKKRNKRQLEAPRVSVPGGASRPTWPPPSRRHGGPPRFKGRPHGI